MECNINIYVLVYNHLKISIVVFLSKPGAYITDNATQLLNHFFLTHSDRNADLSNSI